MMKVSSLLVRGLACGAALLLAVTAPAATAPKFSDPEVTSFCQAYSDFADEYAVAVKAAKAGDNKKAEALAPRLQEIQSKAATVSGKVKPDEAEKFQKFMLECIQRITDAAK